jgi:hypothetical protein
MISPFLGMPLGLLAQFVIPSSFFPQWGTTFLAVLSPLSFQLTGWDYPGTTFIWGWMAVLCLTALIFALTYKAFYTVAENNTMLNFYIWVSLSFLTAAVSILSILVGVAIPLADNEFALRCPGCLI